ncbi:MAG TPA: Ig-like domain-containing protein [Solirubrobacteraceae bacterium]|nr:Ig-like domain-containing protein [Solirubrobacteraceae bacterium]
MTDIDIGGRRLPEARGKAAKRIGRLTTAVLAVAGLLSLGVVSASAGTVTLPGGPLVVSIGSKGQCQSNYVNAGNNFFPGEGTEGDCGFFLGFPEAGNPTALKEKVFGFHGVEGPRLGSTEYTEVSPGSPTGSGTSSDPYKLVSTFKVTDTETTLDYALIIETTTYVNGEPQFMSSFAVENVTGQTVPELTPAPMTNLKFHAIYAGDLYTDNSDFGTGVFLSGPPRFVGGQNNGTGVFGGLIETGTPAWTNYETGCWDEVPEDRCPTTSPADAGIWPAVRAATKATPVFNDDIDPNLIDNAVGVSWDDHLATALKPGETATYSIINRAQIPAGLSIQPVTQTHTVGQTGTVTVTATDNVGTPYANRPLVYSIGGANPKLGSVLTNSSGVATISYVGTAAGLDTMQMYLDLGGTGSQTPSDPAGAAQITWAPAPPTPTGSYRVQSIHANSNGTVTIVFVPVQEGTALVEVTVPTATISRNAIAAKRQKKCKKNQTRIKGKCRPKTTVSGKVSAKGKAGIPLKITVQPSRKVKAALKKGKKVQLTAKLTYKSVLGGTPTVQTFHFTVKAPKKKKKKH